jgi:hypothetical protein
MVRRGGGFDRWDLEVGVSVFGWSCMRMAIEEHGAGRQLVRCYLRPRASRPAVCALLATLALTAIAAADAAPVAAAVLGATALTILAAVVLKAAVALGHLLSAVDSAAAEESTREERLRPSFGTTSVAATTEVPAE